MEGAVTLEDPRKQYVTVINTLAVPGQQPQSGQGLFILLGKKLLVVQCSTVYSVHVPCQY